MWMQLDQSIASNVVAYKLILLNRLVIFSNGYGLCPVSNIIDTYSIDQSLGTVAIGAVDIAVDCYTRVITFLGGASMVLEPYSCIYTPQGV